MLKFAIRDLQRGPVETRGELSPRDPVFEGLDLPLDGPVSIDGELQATEGEDFLWRGSIHASATLPCRRCLADVPYRVNRQVDVLLTSDPEAAEDPSVYPLPVAATQVDLSDVVREELALEVPGFVLCRDDCAGLCPRCGADLNAGPCACVRSAEPV
ncbi:MAG TPA: DUF177 domain-containing protein [Gemmatimonadales bacterium]|jgi:uncharacterized protein|nr:DUF177 domain-containing protein [Gemmatimonadales bacterium]